LDYLPSELAPYELAERSVVIDDRIVRIRTDHQETNRNHHCVNLDRESGRCKIHGRHPFSCDFELLRFVDRGDEVHFNQQLFGRGWAMIRVDNGRGALCSMVPPTDGTIPEILRKLSRLQEWADHFGVDTWIAEVMKWVASGPHDHALHLNA
jgi:Fe-S-cluster containining protein